MAAATAGRRGRYRRSEVVWGAVFVAPALVLFAVMGVYTIAYGLGLDRMVMLFAGVNIRETILFPHVKPEVAR